MAAAATDTILAEATIPPVAERVAGFVGHLRLNGFALGREALADALEVARRAGAENLSAVRLAWKVLFASSADDWRRFDALFEAYWHGRGRARRPPRTGGATTGGDASALWADHFDPGRRDRVNARDAAPGDGPSSAGEASGRLVAADRSTLARTDLRHLADPDEIAAAERLARRLAAALRDRLTRRWRQAAAGPRIDLRRTLRRSVATGGEPFALVRRRRPRRPVRLVALLDVSGSMKPYVRFYLQFLRGLVGTAATADAYLFHTKLFRVGDAIRDRSPAKAMERIALTAEGFGGGTRIGACLADFHRRHGRRALDGRTVVLVLSDGYDTGTPEEVAQGFERLARRARKVVWLNPLIGTAGYAPVARAVAAARPHVDLFATGHSLESLAALERPLSHL